MSKRLEWKKELLARSPECPLCGCSMIASPTNVGKKGHGFLSHAAVIHTDKNGVNSLICFQCNRIAAKRRDFDMLPFKTRCRKRIDEATGIFTFLKRWKKRIHDFIYFNIRGGQRRGKL